MGLHWVINMGVPVVIGICQQSAGSPSPPATFSYSGLTSVTTTYGNFASGQEPPLITVPVGVRLSTTLNAGNGYVYGPDTGAIFYEENREETRINLDVGFIADVSSLPASDLPTDGNCQITYTFTPSTPFLELRDFQTGATIAGSGVGTATAITITGLNRSQITDGSSTTFSLPTIAEAQTGLRFTVGEDAPAGRGYDAAVTILMGNGSQLAPTNQGEARCTYGDGFPPPFRDNLI